MSGYVRQDVAIGFAETAGFKFIGSSEVNADGHQACWTTPLGRPTPRIFRAKASSRLPVLGKLREASRFGLELSCRESMLGASHVLRSPFKIEH
jgi:hypothetical protein